MTGANLKRRRTPEEIRAAAARGVAMRGAAAELYAAARLVEIGCQVAIPTEASTGVDLVVYRPRLLTVQVKSGSYRQAPVNYLSVNLWTRRAGRNSQIDKLADIFCVHAQDTQEWWVVPRDVVAQVGQAGCLRVGGKYGVLNEYLDMWSLCLE